MRAGLSIGDFSQITHLSVKTLRRYHEAGLLQPAEVDPHTGYRYCHCASFAEPRTLSVDLDPRPRLAVTVPCRQHLPGREKLPAPRDTVATCQCLVGRT
jgi:hypothetical protein